jgi:NhaP-type Na+/H+ and K+/H+ antiporter
MVTVKASKSIASLKKGDIIFVDGKKLEVDAHYVFEDYRTTKEMLIELFDPKTDKDYQIRYFNDQIEETLKFYELKDIVYEENENVQKIEW